MAAIRIVAKRAWQCVTWLPLLLTLGTAQSTFAASGDLDTLFNSTGIATSTVSIASAWTPPIMRGANAVVMAGAETLQAVCTSIVYDPVMPGKIIGCNSWQNGINYSRSQVHVYVLRKPSTSTSTTPVALLHTDITNKPADATAIALQSVSGTQAKYIVAQVVPSDPSNIVTSDPIFRLARYTMDESAWTWTLDATFGSSGYVQTTLNGAENIALAVQADGRIIAAVSGKMARYNVNGTLDTTLGPDTTFNTPGVVSIITAVQIGAALQVDGKILLYGSRYNPLALEYQGQLARHNADGSLDVGFGNSGIVDVGLQQSTAGVPFAIQPDGKIVVGGTVAVTNYNSTKLTAPSGYTFYTNAVVDYEYGYTAAVKRFNADGSLDTSFGSGGSANLGSSLAGSGFTNYSAGINEPTTTVYDYTKPFTRGFVASAPTSIVIQNNGKIVVAAHVTEPGLMQNGVVVPTTRYEGWGVMRLTSNGSFDVSTTANTPFSVNGKLVISFANGAATEEPAVGLQTDGKIVATSIGLGSTTAIDPSFIAVRWLGDAVAANELRVTKVVSQTQGYVGSSLTYTVAVNNVGSAAQSSVTLADVLPAGVAFVTANASQGTCSFVTSTVTCVMGSISAGQGATATIVVTPTAVSSALNNCATATSSLTSATSCVALPIVAAAPNLIVTQIGSSETTAPAGGDFPVTLTVKNIGSVATAVAFDVGVRFASDPLVLARASISQSVLPNQTATVVWPLPGEVFAALVPDNYLPGTYDLLGVADLDNTITESSESDNALRAIAPMEVLPYANLAITMTDTPDPALLGEQLTYLISVSNPGPSTAESVLVTDVLPTGLTFVSATPSQGLCSLPPVVACSLGSVPANSMASVILLVNAPNYSALLTNDASVTSTISDPDLSNNSTSQLTTVGQGGPDLAVTDLAVAPSIVAAGGQATLSDSIQNQGGADASAFSISYDLLTTPPVTLATRSVTGLAAGATDSANTVVTIPSGLPDGTYTLQATADITSQVQENREDNNVRTASFVVGPVIVLADLSIVKTATASVTSGGNINYSLAVNNIGPDAASNVVISDPLPAGVTFVTASAPCAYSAGTVTCNLGNLANGASANVNISVTAPSVTVATTVSNTATVSSSTSDPVSTNDSSTANTAVNPLRADLSIVKTATVSVVSGGNISYSLAVNNIGPDAASNVVISDPLSAGVTFVTASAPCAYSAGTVTCNLGNLANGASANVSISVIAPSVTVATTVSNTATVSSSTADPVSSNDSSTASTTVNLANIIDLRMTSLTADKTSLGVGDKITLSNSVINEGTIATSKSFSVSFYLSFGNSTYETTDKLLGSRSVPLGLAPGASSGVNSVFTVAAATVPQDYIIIARVDPTSTTLPNGAIIESDETDNLKAGPGLTVKRDQDLTFNSALSPSASSVGLGKILPVSNSVQNQGTTGMSASTTVRFYLSSDSTLVMSGTGADYQIGSRSVAILAAGGISSALTNLTIPTTVPALPAPGKAYTLFAYIDPTNTLVETPAPAAEANNSTIALGQINVTVDQDLQVSALTSSATLGSPINVSLALATSRNIVLSNQIKNFGASSTSGSIIVRFYLSTDAIIDPATDIQIGTRTVTALKSGALSTLANTTAVVPTNTAQGPYYLGAYVDPLNALAETNLGGNAEQNNDLLAKVAATTVTTMVNVGP